MGAKKNKKKIIFAGKTGGLGKLKKGAHQCHLDIP